MNDTWQVPKYKVQLVREEGVSFPQRAITSPFDIVECAKSYFEMLDREIFVILMVDGKKTVIGMNLVSVGSMDASIAHPREVFKPAILCNADAIVAIHNHPSGDPKPSPDDIEITHRLEKAGDVLGIRLLDHVILGDNGGFFSFHEQHLLDNM